MFTSLVLALAAGACSLPFVKGPAYPGDPACTTSYEAPVADLVIGAAIIAASAYAESVGGFDVCEHDWDSCNAGEGLFLGGVIAGAPLLGSAIYGAGNVADCNESRRAARLRTARPP